MEAIAYNRYLTAVNRKYMVKDFYTTYRSTATQRRMEDGVKTKTASSTINMNI